MKKLLIIIGISILFLTIAIGAAAPTFNIPSYSVEEVQKSTSTCLQLTTDKPVEEAVWNLDSCYWFVDNPYIPYELQKILDSCDTESMGLDILREFTNDTHYINNNTCEWKTIEKVTDSLIIPNAERDVKLAAGYKLYPGVGWVSPAEQNTMEPIYRVHPETGEKVLDLNAMILAQKILDTYKDVPEVMAFYAKYDDAQASVREDHISYFAGSDDDALMRMNVFFDEKQTITEIDIHCYFQKVHQYEIPQEDIINRLEKYDCKK